MALETLTCSVGGHTFTRESKRGVKPKICIPHKANPNATFATSLQKGRIITVPAKKAASVKAPALVSVPDTGTKMQTLHCRTGNHEWQRPSARGVKPADCPQHKHTGFAPKNVVVRVRPETVTGDVPQKSNNDGDELTEFDEYGRKSTITREQAALRKAAADKRIDELEIRLKSNGTHISQQ